MKVIAVTERVTLDRESGEHRDGLDQRWFVFLEACGLTPVLIPNHLPTAQNLLSTLPIQGVLLTGGDDLIDYGGGHPERDEVETFLIRLAETHPFPLLGVCRGMQAIQHYFSISLYPVDGHVTTSQSIEINGNKETINSYHLWGTRETMPPLTPWAVASDGVIKAIRHRDKPIAGIMWHPERITPYRAEDISYFRLLFGESN